MAEVEQIQVQSGVGYGHARGRDAIELCGLALNAREPSDLKEIRAIEVVTILSDRFVGTANPDVWFTLVDEGLRNDRAVASCHICGEKFRQC